MKEKKTARLALAILALLLSLGGVPMASAAETVPEPPEPVRLAVNADVGEPGCNSASFDLGQIHTWYLRSTLPGDIADAQHYALRIQIDHRLTLAADSMEVRFYPGNDEPVMLQPDTHYHVSEAYPEHDEGDFLELTVTLTREAMAFVGKRSGFREGALEVTFRASINRKAMVGVTIPNLATLSYTAPSGTVYTVESDRAEVHTGGIVLRKTDSAGNPLEGAAFRIARPGTDGFHTDMLILEEELVPVTYPQFACTRDLSGGMVSEAITDEDGMAVLYGLAYGTYYIVETRAPEGYNLLTEPIAVIIDESSHLTEEDGWKDAAGNTVDNTVRVVNTKFLLPDSGGWGTDIYVVTGLWIMLAAVILLLMNVKGHPFG